MAYRRCRDVGSAAVNLLIDIVEPRTGSDLVWIVLLEPRRHRGISASVCHHTCLNSRAHLHSHTCCSGLLLILSSHLLILNQLLVWIDDAAEHHLLAPSWVLLADQRPLLQPQAICSLIVLDSLMLSLLQSCVVHIALRNDLVNRPCPDLVEVDHLQIGSTGHTLQPCTQSSFQLFRRLYHALGGLPHHLVCSEVLALKYWLHLLLRIC